MLQSSISKIDVGLKKYFVNFVNQKNHVL